MPKMGRSKNNKAFAVEAQHQQIAVNKIQKSDVWSRKVQ